MLAASGAIRAGQYVVHTSGRHGLAVLEPGRRGRRPPGRAAPGDDLHRHRGRPRPRWPGCVFGVTAGDAERAVAERWSPTSAATRCGCPRTSRTLYHAALAHGANHLVTLVTQAMELLRAAGADDPAATLRPLLDRRPRQRARPGRRRAHRPDRARRRRDGPGPPRRDRRRPRRTPSRRTSRWRAPPPTGVVTDGRLLPIRAAKIRQVLDDGRCSRRRRSRRAWPARRRDERRARPRAHPRGARALLAARPGAAGRRVGVRPHHGGAARRARRADAASPATASPTGRGGVDLRQPAAVRAGRGPRPLPAHPRRRPRGLRPARASTSSSRRRRRGLPRRRAAGHGRPRPARRRPRGRGSGPATSAACSPWSPSCSAWSGPTSPCSGRRTTSSSC